MPSLAPKSILKKTAHVPPASPPPEQDVVSILPGPRATTGTKPTPSEARAIALSHAHALQIRKALELSILTSLEELVDFPTAPVTYVTPPISTVITSPTPTPTPTPTPIHNDPQSLKLRLRYFQPSDYDSLILERNILHLCGYPLCPHPKKSKATSNHILIDKGLPTMRFVPRSKLERFCSDLCARRGLWLRVQLNDEPSWLRGDVLEGVEVGEKGEVTGLDLEGEKWRREGGEEKMVLLEEMEEQKRDQSLRSVVKEGDLKKLVKELEGLGIEIKELLERKTPMTKVEPVGRTGVDFIMEGKEVPSGAKPLGFTVEEKEVSGSGVVPPSSDIAPAVAALAIEGYNPRKRPEDYLPENKNA